MPLKKDDELEELEDLENTKENGQTRFTNEEKSQETNTDKESLLNLNQNMSVGINNNVQADITEEIIQSDGLFNESGPKTLGVWGCCCIFIFGSIFLGFILYVIIKYWNSKPGEKNI